MREIERVELATAGARALAWIDGDLYDVAAGWKRYPLDGSPPANRYTGFGRSFDSVAVAPNADVVALYCSTGTKGLLLEPGGRVIREVNRSFYCAEAYRYPLALFTMPDGRTAAVHCPDDYNRLEIGDARTGELLSVAPDRRPADFFHSRLAVSDSCRYLLSAGWFWHPWGHLALFDLQQAVSDARILDSGNDDLFPRLNMEAEVAGACFVDDDILVSTTSESDSSDEPVGLSTTALARWSIADRRFVWHRQLEETPGDLLPFGGHVLALYRYPRLYDAATGDLLAEWPDLLTGEADGAIVGDRAFSGPARVAIDNANLRFAITDGDRIVVVQLAEARPS